jgi:hypothetical protein
MPGSWFRRVATAVSLAGIARAGNLIPRLLKATDEPDDQLENAKAKYRR